MVKNNAESVFWRMVTDLCQTVSFQLFLLYNCSFIILGQVKKLYTVKRVLTLRCLIPLFWIIAYSWMVTNIQVYEQENGVRSCQGKPEKLKAYDLGFVYWAALYLFVPALLILILNIAIVVKIRSIQQRRTKLSTVPHRNT